MISARTKKVWLQINQAIMQRAFHWEDVIAELTEQLYLDLERKMNSANVPSLSLDVIILIKWYNETCGKNRLIFRKEVLYYFRSLYRLSNDFNVNEEFAWLEDLYEKILYLISGDQYVLFSDDDNVEVINEKNLKSYLIKEFEEADGRNGIIKLIFFTFLFRENLRARNQFSPFYLEEIILRQQLLLFVFTLFAQSSIGDHSRLPHIDIVFNVDGDKGVRVREFLCLESVKDTLVLEIRRDYEAYRDKYLREEKDKKVSASIKKSLNEYHKLYKSLA